MFAFRVILLELLSGKEAAFADAETGEQTLLWETAEEVLVADGSEDVDRVEVRAFMDSTRLAFPPVFRIGKESLC